MTYTHLAHIRSIIVLCTLFVVQQVVAAACVFMLVPCIDNVAHMC
jgi:hypothetical protein